MANHAALPEFFEIGFKCLALALRLLSATLQHGFGYGRAGVDGVHVDTEGTKRVRQGLCQGDARDVAGRRADGGTRSASSAAAQVDDPTPTSLFHIRRGLARAAVIAEEFFFKVFDDLLVTDDVHIVRDGAADAGGAVDQDMDSAQSFCRPPDEPFDRFRVQCIHDEWNDLMSGLLSDLRGSLTQRPLGPGADRNVAAFARQLPRYRFAHAAAAAGNDCRFALKLKIHASSESYLRST